MISRFDADLRRVSELIAAKRAEEAIPLVQSLLASSPGDVSLWSMLSSAQAQAGSTAGGDRLATARAGAPAERCGGMGAAATLQEATGDLAGSAASLSEAERLEPELGSVCIVRAMQALQVKRYDEALRWAQEARRRDPTRFTSDSLVVEGRVREAMARPGEGLSAPRAGIEPSPATRPSPAIHSSRTCSRHRSERGWWSGVRLPDPRRREICRNRVAGGASRAR